MIRYRPFELHTHTVHSDGDFTSAALVQAAHDFGCAGIALTDHNTDAGMQEIYEAARDLWFWLQKNIKFRRSFTNRI